MISYKTLKEKAFEWDISLRHLQYLCQQGKIDGAIKKAGVWFIPDGVPPPTRYTKVRDGKFNFVGTKQKIFNCAIGLFKSRGFEAVSIKDIADAVGITQSSVYNHFESKQKILNTIYDYYCYYFLRDRPDLDDVEPILRDGSLTDIVTSVRYLFSEEHNEQMTDITIIIFQRCSIDDRARMITKSLMIDEGIRFVQEVFDRAVEIGRIAPTNTRAMSMLVNSISIFTLHSWLAAPGDKVDFLGKEDEIQLYQFISKLLTDLKLQDGT